MVDLTPQPTGQLDVEIPKKQGVATHAVSSGIVMGAITTGLGSSLNVSHQAAKAVADVKSAAKASGYSKDVIKELIKQAKKDDVIKNFSKESHGKWAGIALTAGLAAGATLGALKASEHNQRVDEFRARVEGERAQQALAAMQPGGPTKG